MKSKTTEDIIIKNSNINKVDYSDNVITDDVIIDLELKIIRLNNITNKIRVALIVGTL